MISYALMFLCPVALYLVAVMTKVQKHPIWMITLFGYLVRMGFQYVSQNIAFFTTHVARSDSLFYELGAQQIASVWERTGIHYVTAKEMPWIGAASLPSNLFAIIIYVNNGIATEGCTAICALSACLTTLNIYFLARELGVPDRRATLISALILYSPAFVFHTSDTYKDGLVIFFTIGSLASSIRLSRRFSVLHAVVGVLCLWALWYVRFYLVFITVMPLFVGLAGLNSKSVIRPVMFAIIVFTVGFYIANYSEAFNEAYTTATTAFDVGTSARVRTTNARIAGSGVTFDDNGDIYGALHIKILYTLFSPFPWQAGSFGLQLGKFDATIGTYFFYRSILAIKRRWANDRGTLLTLLSFIVPLSFIYALNVANIGLVFRQRMPIVFMLILLGALSWNEGKIAEVALDLEAPKTRAERIKALRKRLARPRPAFLRSG
ncbi:MAG: hypothetical protein U0174_21150 [Polyangiaceae bacterium]